MTELTPKQDILEVDIYDYIQVLWKRRVIILLIFLTATLTSMILSWFILPPLYETKTSLMVPVQPFINLPNWSTDTSDKQPIISLSSWSIDTYVNIAKGATVKTKTFEILKTKSKLNFNPFFEVKTIRDTSIIELIVRYERAIDAARIANTWAQAFIQEVNKLREIEIEKIIKEQNATLNALLALLSKEPPVIAIKKSIIDDTLMAQIMTDITKQTGKSIIGLSIKTEESNPIYQELVRQVTKVRMTLKLLETWRTIINEDHSELVKVISPAIVPLKPIAPRRFLNVIIAGVLSLMVGIFVAFGQEWFERSARTERGL